ncbi:hypothetical protein P167DRAFT_166087 [Morchella conica CCBAS932]|uniref:Uncharacterized protein n=1 Tax=Morchella conica CCBAS932 TaxID=1392247 RepID=A0A3N4KUX7_9PEZI|nr:hypothetical protein P167DRAFT_166087 [Morchella conica CCBAS932]
MAGFLRKLLLKSTPVHTSCSALHTAYSHSFTLTRYHTHFFLFQATFILYCIKPPRSFSALFHFTCILRYTSLPKKSLVFDLVSDLVPLSFNHISLFTHYCIRSAACASLVGSVPISAQ